MSKVADSSFSLADRYTALDGDVLVTGIQALARVPLDQMRADRLRGIKTAAFVSGYQGSPLGGFDRELLAHSDLLADFGVKFWPGQNEELAATAVAGSQLVANMRTANVEGVAGYWYGKAPGLERAADAIRHAVFTGTAEKGGVLAMIGDDPACKSSTLPSRSDAFVSALGFPLLDPGTMQDVLDLGRHGIEMSRACGLWSGLKIVTSIADGSGAANVRPDRLSPILPTLDRDGKPWRPMLSAFVLSPNSLEQEAEIHGPRIELAQRYIEQNKINQLTVSSTNAWLTIIASGYIAELVTAALGVLGLTPEKAGELGIRVLKLRAIHPFDVAAVRSATSGVSTVMVVEEKRAYIETLVRDALYASAERPSVVGKTDATGATLIPNFGALSVDSVVGPLRRMLLANISAERLAPIRQKIPLSLTVRDDAVRTAYFCSGCPHNTSTVVPEGSYVGIGIGCHGMVSTIQNDNRGEFTGITQMGGEGLHWVGMAPFVDTPHIFQNLGDGTFFHSGQLAVQAAISSGVTMTYKILYNAAVAMTGGQDATGLLTVPQMAAKLRSEGVKHIIVTTDDIDKYKGISLGEGVSVRHRDKIIEAQEELRSYPGVTVLIHDQQCAAEKRRDRKRGLLPTPKTRIVIDHRVCEGCGDCGVQSNCLSLEPLETEYGRKTNIDQASCNLDTSCIKGDCPAFVTVTPAAKDSARQKRSVSKVSALTAPIPSPVSLVPSMGSVVRMPGIGGTGVVTVSQLLLAAARIDGVAASAIDQTGLSQKAGPVVSTVTFGEPDPGRVHVLLAFDLLSGVSAANVEGMDAEWSHVVGSTSVTPTGRMIGNVAAAPVDLAQYKAELNGRSGTHNLYVDGPRLTVGLMGNGITSNVFMLGVAFQQGLLPLTADAIERAIELNGTAVEANKASFAWGRSWVVDPVGVAKLAATSSAAPADTDGLADLGSAELVQLVAARRKDLRAYQNRQYADKYVDVVRRAAKADNADDGFAMVVAHQLFRVMAYKDEYEVARLLSTSTERIEQSLGGPIESMTFNLHPPTLRAMGMGSKLKLGPRTKPLIKTLAKMKPLRGTALDPFGRTEMRRTERALVGEYVELVDRLIPLARTDQATAIRIAGLIDQVRGYESVKERNLVAYRTSLNESLKSIDKT
jgi:indolepyruvate ferredoxin oxidoreductase